MGWDAEILPPEIPCWSHSRTAQSAGEEVEGRASRRLLLSHVEIVDDRPVYELRSSSLSRMAQLGASWHLRVVKVSAGAAGIQSDR